LSFNSSTKLAPGESTDDIIVRALKGNGATFNESNDWSQSLSTMQKPTTHITLYVKGGADVGRGAALIKSHALGALTKQDPEKNPSMPISSPNSAESSSKRT